MDSLNPTQAQLQTESRKAKREHLELTVLQGIRACGLPEPECQYKFAKQAMGRKWAFDFAWPEHMVALEVEGGQWVNGRHNRGKGLENDAIKYNNAQLLGWDVYRATTSMVEDGRYLDLIEYALGDR